MSDSKDNKDNEIKMLWNYINKLEHLLVQSFKDKFKFKTKLKSKLKK